MSTTIIESLGVYLPPKVVTTAEVLAGCSKRLAIPFEAVTGIRSRRMAGDTELSIDLAHQAVADCLAGSKYTPADIDLLICANISRYDGANGNVSFEPSTSLRLKARWGFVNALVLDVNNACAGMFTAVLLADAMIQAGLVRRGMVVSGEYITHLTRTAQREIEGPFDQRLACLTLGDAGAAVILEKAPTDAVGFHLIDLYTLAKHSRCCIARPTDQPHGGGIMHTDMVRLTAVSIQQSNSYLPWILKRSGVPASALQHVLHHQTSRKSLEGSLRALSGQLRDNSWLDKNLVNNLAERGNTASTSHFVALKDQIAEQAIRSGDGVLFGIFGSGITVGAALYTFDDLPDRLRRSTAPAVRVQPTPAAGRPDGIVFSHRAPRVRVEAVGISPSHTAPETVGLVSAAAEDCFRRTSMDRQAIDLYLHVGTYPSELIGEPAMATLAAGKIPLKPDITSPDDSKVLAFDVLNGGIGFLNACALAQGMVAAARCRTVLVTAAEVEGNAGRRPEELRGLREVGSAVLLTRTEARTGFGTILFKYCTEKLDALTTHATVAEGGWFMTYRKAPDLEEVYLRSVVDAVEELLQVERLDLSQIKVILPPQVSGTFVDSLERALSCRKGQMVNVAENGKDLFTSSTAFGLQTVFRQELAQTGDLGLIVEVAAGIQVGVALYYF